MSLLKDMSPHLAPGSVAAEGQQATRVRWRIVALLAIIAGLTYLDRLNLSIAGKYIQDEFAFGTETLGWILSAFVLGYALFQVPGGWLGDRLGPRGVLTFGIVWWSVFTAATGIAPRLPLAHWFGLVGSFTIMRFLVGVGEAVTFPSANKIVANWMGTAHRGLGNALVFVGIGVGGALTPMFIAWTMQRWGWRTSFYLCTLMGGFVALTWHLYATNRPEDHPGVNAAELAVIRLQRMPSSPESSPDLPVEKRPPWRRILSSASVWGLILSAGCIAYAAYIFHTWFFIYLVRVRGLTVTQGGFWGSMPYLGIMLLAPLGGWLSDRWVARFGKRRGRRLSLWLGATCSATLLWVGGHTANNNLAILLLAAAAGFNLFATAILWATCIDRTPHFSGTLSGLMNMCANLGGWLSPIITAHIATRFGWVQALDFAALVTLSAGTLWVLVNADHNLEKTSVVRRP